MLYKSEYGTWSHGNRNTGTHNNLGMAFAWYGLNKKIFNNIELSDSPDFQAISEINNNTILWAEEYLIRLALKKERRYSLNPTNDIEQDLETWL